MSLSLKGGMVFRWDKGKARSNLGYLAEDWVGGGQPGEETGRTKCVRGAYALTCGFLNLGGLCITLVSGMRSSGWDMCLEGSWPLAGATTLHRA